jgi:hypothetical protein
MILETIRFKQSPVKYILCDRILVLSIDREDPRCVLPIVTLEVGGWVVKRGEAIAHRNDIVPAEPLTNEEEYGYVRSINAFFDFVINVGQLGGEQ